MKKISEWLKELPPPIRKKALANFRKQKGPDKKVDELAYAIFQAFVWRDTPQRWRYWAKIYDESLPISFDVYDQAIIDELVDNSEQISKKLSKYNLIWDDKDGWILKNQEIYGKMFGEKCKEYVFTGITFKL